MSIFVNSTDLIRVSVKFRTLTDSQKRVVGIEILPDDAVGADVQEIVCDTTGRDFDNMSKLLESATIINHVTGQPMIRSAVFHRGIISRFFKGWNVDDENGQQVELNNEAVSRMHDSLVRALSRKWLKTTAGKVK